MCGALYPMQYDALSAEAAVLWIEKGDRKAEEKKHGILESLSAILEPVRQGLLFCFL